MEFERVGPRQRIGIPRPLFNLICLHGFLQKCPFLNLVRRNGGKKLHPCVSPGEHGDYTEPAWDGGAINVLHIPRSAARQLQGLEKSPLCKRGN